MQRKKQEQFYTCLSFDNFKCHLMFNGRTPQKRRAIRLFDLYKLINRLKTTTRICIANEIPLYSFSRSLLSRDLKTLKDRNLIFSINERIQWNPSRQR